MTHEEINGQKILVLHTNFPGQFKYLCEELAETNEIIFICKTHYKRRIKKVGILTIKNKSNSDKSTKPNKTLLESSQDTADHYRQAMIKLKDRGWDPDIILSHSGWGCGLHSREVWPKAYIVAYVEWWFNPESILFFYDENNRFLNMNRKKIPTCWRRNQTMALELSVADQLVSPTHWQKSQLPKTFQDKCEVIYDGIDTSYFKPKANKSRKEKFVVTYGTRGMEPMRGFPQFVKAISALASKRENIVIKIAGNDEVNYGGGVPIGEFKSWGHWADSHFKDKNLTDKIEWTGRLNKEDYREFLQESDCHIYLTHPFVASWSLLDALACGAPIVASQLECVSEITRYAPVKNQVQLIDHRKNEEIVQAIDRLYKAKMTYRSETKTATNTSHCNNTKLSELSLESSMRHWKRLISRGLAAQVMARER